MRFSDIKGEDTIDVVAELIGPVMNIASDEEASGLFSREPLPEGVTGKQFVMRRIGKYVPSLLKNHKDDIVTILSSIKRVSKEEYLEGLAMDTLIIDLAELCTDPQFLQFFT